MNTDQKLFLIINIIGGVMVLGSYYLGIKSGKGADALWGGVPENIRLVYTLSMLICALAYFVFFAYILKNLGLNTLNSSFLLGEKLYLVLFMIILAASSAWMPLANVMVASPSTLVWIGIRTVLILVGLASLGVVIGFLTINPRPSESLFYASLVGMIWFTIHTGVLDAIIWPYFWGK